MVSRQQHRSVKIVGLTGLLIALLVASTAVVLRANQAEAADSACDARFGSTHWPNDTFFSEKCPAAHGFLPHTGPVKLNHGSDAESGGYVIPRTAENTALSSEALAGASNKTAFYNKLRFHYFNRGNSFVGNWAQDGASFVVMSLIGKNPPAGGSRALTAADWVEFKRRLDNPNLTMSLDNNYPLSPNSSSVWDSSERLDFSQMSDPNLGSGPSFVFKLNGVEVGAIERKCANLLGQFALPPAPAEWTIRGESYINNRQGTITARPGDVLNWRHDLRNNSRFNMDRNIFYNIDRTGYTNGWNGIKTPSGNRRGNAGVLFVNIGSSAANRTRYVVTAADAGKTFCQRIAWNDASWNNTGWGASSPYACATVPYNYNLVPSVTGPTGVGVAGAPIPRVTPRVNNEMAGNPSGTTVSRATEWQMKRIEVPPGSSLPTTQQQNSSLPCTHYGRGQNTCIDKGSGTRTFPAGSTTLAALNGETIAPDTPVGTKICYTLSVRPYAHNTPQWRHSAPVCVTVSKQPKMQVWGGDVRVRGKIETGTSIVNTAGGNAMFGSWVEYGGFSVGANSGFASAAGLNNGNPNTTSAAAWHKLTFANINDAGASSFGNFTLPAGLPTLTAQFIGTPSAGPVNGNLGALASGTYNTGNLTITASDVGQQAGKGKSIIIVSSGTVTINGNITYRGPEPGDKFSRSDQIPQVVIIARTINITNTATQVDAWLLTTGANGLINTCSDRSVAAPLNSTVCSNPLTVNGPVATNHLHLRRTAGSDTIADAGKPAEVFNLRPDTYIWAYLRASQSGKAQTVYSVELPPRF